MFLLGPGIVLGINVFTWSRDCPWNPGIVLGILGILPLFFVGIYVLYTIYAYSRDCPRNPWNPNLDTYPC